MTTYKVSHECHRKLDLMLPAHLRLCWVQWLDGRVYYAEQLNEALSFVVNIFSSSHNYITANSDKLVKKLLELGVIKESIEKQPALQLKEYLADPKYKWPRAGQSDKKPKKKPT